MATAQSVGTIDSYLTHICEAIQLTSTQFNTAVRRYRDVGIWLTQQESALDRLTPSILPQGSMLQRTTIRPTRVGKESVPFDIDTVCRCEFDPHAKSSQSLYGSVQARLLASDDFRARHEEARRELGTSGKCIRLAYATDDFYLDVVPMCVDPTDPAGIRMLMCKPDRWHDASSPIETWKRTDPFRFAAWIESRCKLRTDKAAPAVMASVSPVPPQEVVEVKAPLRQVIQLLKRRRDLEFVGDNCRPTSILLSTLSVLHYRGEQIVSNALAAVLDGIAGQIDRAGPARIRVANPADEIAPHDGGVEDLITPLTDEAYAKFCAMIRSMRSLFAECRTTLGVPKLFPLLAELFGQGMVRRAFNAAEEEVAAAGVSGAIGSAASGSAIRILGEPKMAGSVQPVPTNHFHQGGA